MHSEGGVSSSPARSYLYCTPSLSSADHADTDAIFVLCRMQIRGMSRLRTRCRSRLWIFETTRVLKGPFLNHSISLLRLSTPLILSSAVPKGPRPGNVFHYPKNLTRAASAGHRLTPLILEVNLLSALPLSPFVGHSDLSCSLAHACIFFGPSLFTSRFVVCCLYEGRLGAFRVRNFVL